MKIPSRIAFLTSAFAGGFLFLMSGTAFAHGLNVSADAVCDEGGGIVIHYTAQSTSTLPEGSHSNIVVSVNGIQVGSGAFVAPVNAFSGSVAAPVGTSATVTAQAVGNWLDGATGGQSSSVTVTYPTDCTAPPGLGRFTGGGNQIRVGEARVTRGLTIHCDLVLSNNLEVNWGGNKFHMTEHLTTVACTDDPAIIQAPPVAPLDTLIGVGEGRYNNVYGYTIEFTLRDYGEPGREDQMRIYIYETANPANIVLNVPLQVLSGGNLQAHYDQPHQ
jgi:hypothetical protein